MFHNAEIMPRLKSLLSTVNTNAFLKAIHNLHAICDDANVCFVPLKVPYYSHFQVLAFIGVKKDAYDP